MNIEPKLPLAVIWLRKVHKPWGEDTERLPAKLIAIDKDDPESHDCTVELPNGKRYAAQVTDLVIDTSVL